MDTGLDGTPEPGRVLDVLLPDQDAGTLPLLTGDSVAPAGLDGPPVGMLDSLSDDSVGPLDPETAGGLPIG